ncbi:MAG: Maf family nucleotide pyrophosphatase [Flavobacteriales bacterium]
MFENLRNKKIKLASKSPRRQQLLGGLGLEFELWTKEVDEDFPKDLQREAIPLHLAAKKADAFRLEMQTDDLVITADTIVWIDNRVLNKPADRAEAIEMLRLLSGKMHEVYTGVSIMSIEKTELLWDCTRVHFATLSQQEIEYYVDHYSPFDKAGSYGAQDWIGLIGIDRLEGSYFNVMGLPVHKVYKVLQQF